MCDRVTHQPRRDDSAERACCDSIDVIRPTSAGNRAALAAIMLGKIGPSAEADQDIADAAQTACRRRCD